MMERPAPPPPSPDAATSGAWLGDDPLAPKPVSYYDQPLLKRPGWGREVVAYLFVGGLMGGSGMLVALCDEAAGDEALARNARYLALALAAASPAILISHLGRPERFHHMLRVVKFRSPMSMGVWGLVAFSAVAGLSAAAQASQDGWLPGWLSLFAPRVLTKPLQALLGAFTAGYTGVLISATAIPLWAKGKRHIPALSVCSGVAGACAANAILLTFYRKHRKTRKKLERLELIAGIAELALLLSFQRHAGELGAPMFEGLRGDSLRSKTVAGGILLPALLHLMPGHWWWKSLGAAVLTLTGGYTLRETLIEAGKLSADDPRVAFRQPE